MAALLQENNKQRRCAALWNTLVLTTLTPNYAAGRPLCSVTVCCCVRFLGPRGGTPRFINEFWLSLVSFRGLPRCPRLDLPSQRVVRRLMFANRSSNVLRTTRRFCAAGSRFEWQTLPSGLRIKHVRLAAHGGLGRPPEGCFPCSTQVSDGNQGDEPVGDNQTIRVTYSTRLEDNTVLISNRVASFKVGTSSQVRHAPAPPTPPPPCCCCMSSCLWRALLRSARRLTRECGECVLETAGAHPHRVLPHGVPPP